ncbi:MAG: GuaB3 family IMP dehydrogenase-related protein [Chloroflexi bacterium]|mgnify:CR=1 FL=1|nr:GuaB3 family IMP dehydrogenase-related protein [Chloroflexota bacterium]|tara:strand:+ start:2151 stop:3293 length:1143 start_codon:yes stop_codon:yes gene_type:complete
MEARSFKQIQRAYGFDEVAIAPGPITLNPEFSDTSLTLGEHHFEIPLIASAMDAVVSPGFSGHMSNAGGFGVLNLEGIWTRYQNAEDILQEISTTPLDQITTLFQRLYSEPIKDALIEQRINEIKSTGAVAAVSMTPQRTKHFSKIAVESGVDILVVQATVTTARHTSKSERGLILSDLVKEIDIPIVVGNCATYDVAMELLEEGIHGLLIGIGPGAACTTREVVGVGIPQITATIECAAAREDYYNRTGRYVPIITDGGIRTGGELCKALVAGADGAMLGTPFAQAVEAPGLGYNWGMATPDPALPRGTRINVGTRGSLKEILFGPSLLTDGTMNFIGALKACMGMVGAANIRELQQASLIYAPDIKAEGKSFQAAQKS